jgi:hypothetical protein
MLAVLEARANMRAADIQAVYAVQVQLKAHHCWPRKLRLPVFIDKVPAYATSSISGLGDRTRSARM